MAVRGIDRYLTDKTAGTWNTIADRLRKFSPRLDLQSHIDFAASNAVVIHEYPSEGIDFIAANGARLIRELQNCSTDTGKPAYIEGRWKGAKEAVEGAKRDLMANFGKGKPDRNSWALDISFKATKGVGFREIWYLEVTERQLKLRSARPVDQPQLRLDPLFAGRFEAPNSAIDLSALHWAIGDPDPASGMQQCNVHIDNVGVTADLGGGMGAAITPDLLYHTVVELGFRTGLKGFLPDSVLQRVDFVLPSSHENYALNFGAQVTAIDRKDLKLKFRGVCSVHDGGCDWSATVSLSGTSNLLGGRRR